MTSGTNETVSSKDYLNLVLITFGEAVLFGSDDGPIFLFHLKVIEPIKIVLPMVPVRDAVDIF